MRKSKQQDNQSIKTLSPLINMTEPNVQKELDDDVKILSPLICIEKTKVAPATSPKDTKAVEVSDARLILAKPSPLFFIVNGFIILLLSSILAVLSYMMFSTSIRDEQFFINLIITPIFFYFLYDRIKLVYSTLVYGPQKPKKEKTVVPKKSNKKEKVKKPKKSKETKNKDDLKSKEVKEKPKKKGKERKKKKKRK